MAITLTSKLKSKLSEGTIQQQIIAEIEGIDYVFGSNHVTESIRIGNDVRIGDDDFFIGGSKELSNSLPLIIPSMMSAPITQRISQEEGISSISGMNLALTDEDGILSSKLSPTESYDVLGKQVNIYTSVIGLSHPENSIKIFQGIIEGCSFASSSAILKVAHPEKLKQQALFVKTETELTASIDSTTTEIPAIYKDTLLQPTGSLEAYIRIGDELIQYDYYQNGMFKNCVRHSLNTQADSHSSGDTIETFYVLKGNPLDLALSLYTSTIELDGYDFVSGMEVLNINQVNSELFVKNSLSFNREEFEKHNITIGDTLSLDHVNDEIYVPGDNTITQASITSINCNDSVCWVEINKPLVTDSSDQYIVNIRSQYSTLSDGCELDPSYIDIEEFKRVKALHSSELVDCEIYIKDTIDNAKEFIDKIILRPQGLLSVPRKGRISVNKTAPPLADNETVTLNYDNISNPSNISIERKISSNFYNAVIYKFNQDSIEDKFLRTDIYNSEESSRKIKVGVKPLVIEASSLRDNPDVRSFIEKQSKTFLDTFKHGAETIKLETDYATGIPLEVGDSVICDLSKLNVTDITTGKKIFTPRIMKIENKSLNLISNKVSLDMVSTTFKTDGRYGVISPASIIRNGSTKTLINIKKSYGFDGTYEKEKWTRYIGQRIRVKNYDYTVDVETRLLGVDDVLDQLIVEPLDNAPEKDMVVCMPKYDDSNSTSMNLWKSLHVFINPSVKVVSSSDSRNIVVSATDINKFTVGAIVNIRTRDHSESSEEMRIEEIIENTIRLDKTISFSVSDIHQIELIGFKDKGLPYRII